MMHRQTSVFFPAHLPLAQLDSNARTILERRYLRHDDAGVVCETPEELFWRVAWNIALADGQYDQKADIQKTAEKFYLLMAECKFLPNSPCLRGAGRELQQLFGCFVLPIEDSLDSIFETLKITALIHKTGGGTGFSFSRLRPRNAPVRTTAGCSSGPISFMRVFNAATSEITQGGVRMGANMGILRVDHPDIEEFIDCKLNDTAFTSFNISVAINDAFVAAIENNGDYDIIDPRTNTIVGKKNARFIFEKIVQNAWKNGDPGIIFLDRINASESNMTPAIGAIESTNPCGEQPLLPYESCVLGSINLAKFATEAGIDWDALKTTIHDAAHFLDNVIDMNHYVIPKIEEMTKGLRRFGLGVMGFADMLIALSIPYNSPEAVALAKKVMQFVDDQARDASEQMALKRGAFPFFKKSLYATQNRPLIRNVARTTIAPTGTISTIAGCSSGIEPIFALVHRRKSLWKQDGSTTELLVTNKQFEARARAAGVYSEELMAKIFEKGSLQGIAEIPAELKKVFVTSHDIEPDAHINIQAAFQNHVNNAVSKTINFPHNASLEDVSRAYLFAYHKGCKGITIYRDGSRSIQVLTVGSGTKAVEQPVIVKNTTSELSFAPATPLDSLHDYMDRCPECGASIEAGEGCFKCLQCGHSRCS